MAIWEIEGDALYLKGLDAWVYDRRADLKTIFPRTFKDGRVKAEWLSGTLTLNTTLFPWERSEQPQVTVTFKDGNLTSVQRDDGPSGQR